MATPSKLPTGAEVAEHVKSTISAKNHQKTVPVVTQLKETKALLSKCDAFAEDLVKKNSEVKKELEKVKKSLTYKTTLAEKANQKAIKLEEDLEASSVKIESLTKSINNLKSQLETKEGIIEKLEELVKSKQHSLDSLKQENIDLKELYSGREHDHAIAMRAYKFKVLGTIDATLRSIEKLGIFRRTSSNIQIIFRTAINNLE